MAQLQCHLYSQQFFTKKIGDLRNGLSVDSQKWRRCLQGSKQDPEPEGHHHSIGHLPCTGNHCLSRFLCELYMRPQLPLA